MNFIPRQVVFRQDHTVVSLLQFHARSAFVRQITSGTVLLELAASGLAAISGQLKGVMKSIHLSFCKFPVKFVYNG